jgi:hypothetical protein
MQQVTSILDRYKTKPLQQQTTHLDRTPERTQFLKGVLTELTRMKLLTDSNPETLGKIYQTWAAGLDDLPDHAIRMGMIRAKDFTDYFSLPAFRELCRVTPEDMGLKTAKAAYIEACNMPLPWERGNWSSGAVYAAARETGRHELHTSTEREIFPLFKSNYETMCARVLSGEALDRPVQKALPETVPNPTSPEVAKVRLAALKGML